jgi:hypothetical protein
MLAFAGFATVKWLIPFFANLVIQVQALVGASLTAQVSTSALFASLGAAGGPIGALVALTGGLVIAFASLSSAEEDAVRGLTALGVSTNAATERVKEAADGLQGVDVRATRLRHTLDALTDEEKRAAETAQGWAMRQRAVQHELDESRQRTARLQAAIHKFAGMSQKVQAEWATETGAQFDAVGATFDALANKAKLTADKVIHQFQRQAAQIANYRDNLQTVAARNIPDVLLQQLIDMGIGGAGILAELAGASDRKFAQMVRAMQAARRQAQGIRNDLAELRREAERDIVQTIQIVATGVGTGFHPVLRQHGGPVSAMRPYIVGEKGPELFVPATSGHVVAGARSRDPLGGPSRIDVTIDRRRWVEQGDYETTYRGF